MKGLSVLSNIYSLLQVQKQNLGFCTPGEVSKSFSYLPDDFLNQKAFLLFPCTRGGDLFWIALKGLVKMECNMLNKNTP